MTPEDAFWHASTNTSVPEPMWRPFKQGSHTAPPGPPFVHTYECVHCFERRRLWSRDSHWERDGVEEDPKVCPIEDDGHDFEHISVESDGA